MRVCDYIIRQNVRIFLRRIEYLDNSDQKTACQILDLHAIWLIHKDFHSHGIVDV